MLLPEYMVPIHLFGVTRHVAQAGEHGTAGLLILHLVFSRMSLLLYSRVTDNI